MTQRSARKEENNMGTDIYMAAEVHDPVTGKWRFVTEEVFPNMWYDGFNDIKSRTNIPQDGRNYTLFNILCGGVMGWSKYDPIAYARGLPVDISDEAADAIYANSGWTHSHSHLYLSDLLDYEWNKYFSVSVYFPRDQWINYITKDYRPRYWFGDRPQGEAVVGLADDYIDENGEYYIPVPENVDFIYGVYKEAERDDSCDFFVDYTIPALKTLMVNNDPTSVRIVFTFDS